MPLTSEQIRELKKQILEQVKHLPEEKRKEINEHIENMSPEAIEEMLINQKSTNVMRMIVSKKIKSWIIEENEDVLAVLDIKPITKGHTIIIPKKPIYSENINENVISFAEELSKKIKEKLKSKDVLIEQEIKFGEKIINLIPVYDGDKNKERYEATEDELSQIQNILTEKEDKEEIVIDEKKEKEIIKLKRKIP